MHEDHIARPGGYDCVLNPSELLARPHLQRIGKQGRRRAKQRRQYQNRSKASVYVQRI
jgi:hypothetical protein